MKYLFALILAIGLLKPVFPCGNEYGYTLDGTRLYTRYFFLSERMLHFDTVEINRRLKELGLKTKTGKVNFKTWSDIAANLMKIGQADSAIKILRPLMEENQNEYNLLANLGTSYELVGQLDSALKYISKGYELNPRSHNGSEWIHVKILEAKIREKKNPGWIDINEIISLEELLNRIDTAKLRPDLIRINQDFFYQVRTRVQFTPAPNKTVANLLVTLGDLNKSIGTYENALLAYIYAMEFQESAYLDRKIKDKIKDLNRQREAQPKINELPEIFLMMMKHSKIDPELLLIGINEYANQLDSMHLSALAEKDSITSMRLQIDSIANTASAEIQIRNDRLSTEENKKYLFLLIGFALGIGLTALIMKRRRGHEQQ